MRNQESGLEDLNVAERGDGPRVVVWLHGFLGSGSEFLPFAESLTGRFRSLLVDLPGHGASPIGEQTSYEGWSGRIRDAVDQLTIERALVAVAGQCVAKEFTIGSRAGGVCSLETISRPF